jgi:hypothetical protein
MSVLDPTLPPYDALAWEKLPFGEKTRMVCEAWALQGYGSPLAAYAAYALKVALYVGAWIWFCSFTPGLGGVASIGAWALHPVAFQKAILWSMLFEALGLGCGSGPLTGRYVPPFGGALYFLRPGTTRLPLFADAPLLRGVRRGAIDVLMYLAYAVLLVRMLTSPAIESAPLWAVVVLLPAMALRDKTMFLVSRGEHYYTTLVCFAAAADWILDQLERLYERRTAVAIVGKGAGVSRDAPARAGPARARFEGHRRVHREHHRSTAR